MITTDIWLVYTGACIVIILSPGPDNLLAIGRGVSQGRAATCLSSLGAAIGLLVHVLAAVLGLVLIVQTSAMAFGLVKAVGATYLIWLGIQAIKSRDLITFQPSQHQTLGKIFITGLLTNVLNPKPAIFILAFLPQFVDLEMDSATHQMLMLGVWFAVLAFVVFAIMGSCASVLTRWLSQRPKATWFLNIGAGLTLVTAGLSIVLLDRR